MIIPLLALTGLLGVTPPTTALDQDITPTGITPTGTTPTHLTQTEADPAGQTSTLDEPPLVLGTFNNGFRYVQIAQDGGRVCLATFFDNEGQAIALNQALGQVRQEAAAAETELEDVLQQQISERRQGILALLADDELLSRTIANEQITPEQVEQIEQFRNNPNALDQFLENQLNEARQAADIEIEQRRISIETELNETASNAANFPAFQGITSVVSTPLPDVYATAADDVILLPQVNGLLLLGLPSQLVSYGPWMRVYRTIPIC